MTKSICLCVSHHLWIARGAGCKKYQHRIGALRFAAKIIGIAQTRRIVHQCFQRFPSIACGARDEFKFKRWYFIPHRVNFLRARRVGQRDNGLCAIDAIIDIVSGR